MDASGGRAAPKGRVKGIARFGAATGGTYDAPRAKPFAAYAIAATHAVVFVIDLVMYTSGHGNGGETFSRLALFDDAVVWGSQWGRVFTASLVDFGLVHFALVNVGLVTVGAEAEAILGGWNFTAVYALSAAVGGLGSMALDSTTLHVASSDGLFGVFGATLLYSAMNVENEWNNRGFTTRLFQCAVFAVGLQSLTAYPTENGAHVVNSVGHLWGFFAGAAMGYAGLAPLFTSGKKFSPPPSDGRKRLTDLHEGPRKTFVILGSVSTALALMSLVVILKRFFDVDPRDVF
ncbi:hypothetical protein BE221DRAFT_103466 [Ostreococcus tauri]|uniref:RHOMBOID-like protein n=1 Tax=Ostreococcus tauri TaxID=70448 RepID=A0A1Y5I6A3_OSTTA|nr:hypothetical protein BE221DRAFT_103466 [Ostreococcus tauri]